ncbi:FAD/NAD(P)-binding protein [Dyadobacter sp. CY261]|uniref:FAD/NAD(P)-binding protein n=1 Tax=Dyadobacter sp. CY261 TaxID=2907203 RepID=UPI001F20BA2E|nr:FAD/NAD(P)-binding protein [Dyadobacter sp. CY261]MCF0072978.1 FAD/NAD(P)-binding protein [Dyadobacter sp. CY261]
MNQQKPQKKIGIVGAGPSCLYLLKHLVSLEMDLEVEIFEKSQVVGAGMPYSAQGANSEHVTNVSGNEIPPLAISLIRWLDEMAGQLPDQFAVDKDNFTQHHVLPRLLFGKYLAGQFELLCEQAHSRGKAVKLHLNAEVTDLTDCREEEKAVLSLASGKTFEFDVVVVCAGHRWPEKGENSKKGYFLSPYPPAKLALQLNHPVAIKGSSLTAIDAIRTLARHNGRFEETGEGKLKFIPAEGSEKFKIVMHSRNGLLPAIRFHLQQPRLSRESLLTREEIEQNRKENGGFLSLDFVFDQNFKRGFQKSDPALYKRIKNMKVEAFVDLIMSMRENKEPFELFREEYEEAEKSIEQRKSIYWKEMLAELSFTMNYPAKYLSAEDMLRLKNVLMPLISVVIAFAPQSSCNELFALHDAGRLDIVSVGQESKVEPLKEGGIRYHCTDEQGKKHAIRYPTFVDCSGQPHLSAEDLPFPGLTMKKSVSQAVIRFKSAEEAEKLKGEGNDLIVSNNNGDFFLKVPGITITDHFQIVNEFGIPNERIYMMAVPYIGGYNPDYSGLDFCEEASRCIVEKLADVFNARHPPMHAEC